MALYHLVSAVSPLWVDKVAIRSCKQTVSCYAWLLVVLSGSFFGLAWCSSYFVWLLFIAIVPMLLMMESKLSTGRSGLCYIFFTLFLWNSLTIWWLYKAAFFAFVFVACYNTLCLALPWCLYYYMRKWGGIYLGYIALLTAWLTLEHAHLSWEWWEISFPWLNLGNGLAALTPWIQWYEYTGILGGSLWILGMNVLLYHLLFESTTSFLLKTLCCWFLLPLLFSLIVYYNHKEKGMAVEAVVVQPNFDSYTEKDPSSPLYLPCGHQIDRLLHLSRKRLSSHTCLVVWPESAINTYANETYIHHYAYMQPILQFLKAHPAVNLITGVTSLCNYGFTQATQTARAIEGQYIDYFNSIFHFKAGKQTAIYHKEKRLPGGEYIPYGHLLPAPLLVWVRKKFIAIGDIDPILGKGDGAKVFEIDQQIKIAPVNCYESVYGAFVGDAAKKGATLLSVITNDNWWGNTPIYHQHFQYSRLLAIAHRRSVMRAANTGISGFINQRGEVIAATNRLEPAVLRQMVYTNNQMTFYSLYGDYIGRIAAWSCLSLFLIMLIIRLGKSKKVAMAN